MGVSRRKENIYENCSCSLAQDFGEYIVPSLWYQKELVVPKIYKQNAYIRRVYTAYSRGLTDIERTNEV